MWIRIRRLEKAQVIQLLGVVTLLITLLTTLFLIRENDRISEKAERANRENARIADCMKRTIRTLHGRSLYSDDLRDLQMRGDSNWMELLLLPASDQSADEKMRIYQENVTEQGDIFAQRLEIWRKQDKFTYPSLDDCD